MRGLKEIPRIGLGTYQVKTGDTTESLVYQAIKLGYRHIDTASVYRNEKSVGMGIKRAMKEGIVQRSDIWVTSKISPKDQGYDKCTKAIAKCLEELDLEWIDLILLHWPGTQGLQPENPKNRDNRVESIRAMKEALDQGLVSKIGVSNFEIKHFEYIPEETEIFCNQIEMHPLIWTEKTKLLVDYCKKRNILIEAYSCLGKGELLNGEYSELEQIALDLKCSVAQVLIAWALHRGFVVMPKASSPERLEQNFAASKVCLSSEHIEILDGMAIAHGAQKFCWDPSLVY